jgi:hypothetical protein
MRTSLADVAMERIPRSHTVFDPPALAAEVSQRLAVALAECVRRRAERRELRAEMRMRRDYGLAARHRVKLERLRAAARQRGPEPLPPTVGQPEAISPVRPCTTEPGTGNQSSGEAMPGTVGRDIHADPAPASRVPADRSTLAVSSTARGTRLGGPVADTIGRPESPAGCQPSDGHPRAADESGNDDRDPVTARPRHRVAVVGVARPPYRSRWTSSRRTRCPPNRPVRSDPPRNGGNLTANHVPRSRAPAGAG